MILRSPFPDVDIPDVALTPFVMRRAAEMGDRPALICAATGRSYSYRALADAIPRCAAGLHALGIRKGHVVGIVSPNIPEFAIVFLAVASLGAVCSTVNPIATAEEIGTQFEDSEARLVVTIPQLLEKCSAATRVATNVREIIVIGDADSGVPFASLFTHGDEAPPVDIDPAKDIVVLP